MSATDVKGGFVPGLSQPCLPSAPKTGATEEELSSFKVHNS